MFVLTVLIFWGADKRSVGDLFSTLAMRQAALARLRTAGQSGSRVPESTSPPLGYCGLSQNSLPRHYGGSLFTDKFTPLPDQAPTPAEW